VVATRLYQTYKAREHYQGKKKTAKKLKRIEFTKLSATFSAISLPPRLTIAVEF
jgi:hypothetical protein